MTQPLKELVGIAEAFYSSTICGPHNLAVRLQGSMTTDELELVSVLWEDMSRNLDYGVGEYSLRDALISQPVQGLQLVEVFTGALRRNLDDTELKKYVPQNAAADTASRMREAQAHNLAAVFSV